MLTSALAIILVLGALIFFHELGHFLLARLFGIGVKTFSLGFGPKIWGFTAGKTQYRLSLVPLGGYVQLAGESQEDGIPEGFTEKECFMIRPPWQRMFVVGAGPIFNLVLAWLIYWGLFLSYGQMELIPKIGTIAENSPALSSGIKPGDLVLKINQKDITYWGELAETIRTSNGQSLALIIDRSGIKQSITVTPRLETRKNLFGEEVKTPMIGISPSGETVTIPLNFFSAGYIGLTQTKTVIALTIEGLIKLVERVLPLDTLGGPIMIAQLVSQQAERGLADVLALTALLSINLGLLNLLPIPVLDGGHLLFYTIETIFRRPLSQRWQQITIRIGLGFLLCLMALAVYNDLARIFTSSN